MSAITDNDSSSAMNQLKNNMDQLKTFTDVVNDPTVLSSQKATSMLQLFETLASVAKDLQPLIDEVRPKILTSEQDIKELDATKEKCTKVATDSGQLLQNLKEVIKTNPKSFNTMLTELFSSQSNQISPIDNAKQQ